MAGRAERIELAAERRTVLGKQVGQLRRQKWVPGIMYGHDFDPVPLQFNTRELRQVLSQVGSSQIISIRVKGQEQPEMALVRDVQRDPIRGSLLHVDFYHVKMTERIRAEIPLEIVGKSPVVELKEGILLQALSAVEVECLPGNLVDAIEVDLSDLTEVDHALYVRDLAVPAGLEVLTDLNEMIVRVVPLEAEEKLEEEVVAPAAEVEVLTAAKLKEEAGEEEK
jgi:large subunit ribosomal protein L25